jgi:hypothetical protein
MTDKLRRVTGSLDYGTWQQCRPHSNRNAAENAVERAKLQPWPKPSYLAPGP